jgi:type II secretory pathway component PulM
MSGLSARERRLIAVLILIAAIALVWLALVSPLIAGFEARAVERERLALEQASNTRLVGTIKRLRQQAEAQRQDNARFHLIAPSPTAAAEALKEQLSSLIADAGGEVRALQDIEAAQGTVAVRVEARVSNARLVALLDQLRTAEPLLIVRSVLLSTPDAVRGGAPDPSGSATGPFDPPGAASGNAAREPASSSRLDIRIEVSASHFPA